MGTPRPNNPEPDRTLVSWKEIASWLDHAERTVKRWERERGLPVHRVPGGKRGSVFAYTSELQAWLLNEQNKEALEAAGDRADESPDQDEVPPVVPDDADQTSAPRLRMRYRTGKWLTWLAAAALIPGLVGAALVSVRLDRRPTRAGEKSTPSAHAAALRAASAPLPGKAEEFYLRGRYYWERRTPDDLNRAVDDFTQAIVQDP